MWSLASTYTPRLYWPGDESKDLNPMAGFWLAVLVAVIFAIVAVAGVAATVALAMYVALEGTTSDWSLWILAIISIFTGLVLLICAGMIACAVVEYRDWRRGLRGASDK
jgi:uncharacterized integral membrane protein